MNILSQLLSIKDSDPSYKMAGGIELPNFKQTTLKSPIMAMPVPPQLRLALVTGEAGSLTPTVKIGDQVKKAKERLKAANNDKPVFSGLFLPHLPKAADLKKAIEVSKQNGAKGFSLFAYGNLKDEYFEGL